MLCANHHSNSLRTFCFILTRGTILKKPGKRWIRLIGKHHTQTHAPTQFQIARAQLTDFEAIAELFAALHTLNAELDPNFALADGWRDLLHDHFRRTCADPRALWLLAWQDNEPVGLLLVEAQVDSPLFHHRTWAELVAIYVVPACRGTSLATQLIDQARAWTSRHGLCRLQLYVTATNQQARAFYYRCGLQPVQEIWRLEVEPDPDAQPLEEWLESLDTDLLEPGQHYHSREKKS